MTYSGDDAALRALRTQLETVGLASAAARSQLAVFAIARVRAGFSDSATPEGGRWAQLRYRIGSPLVLTGRLSRSFRARLTRDGFALETSVPYASYHQTGTARMAARRMLPRDGSLPTSWRPAFERVLGAVIVRHFR